MKKQILTGNLSDFENNALELFQYQAANNAVYHKFIASLGRNPTNITQIVDVPFMPVEFFKYHRVSTEEWQEENLYTSSGTTQSEVSKHFIRDEHFYLEHSRKLFEAAYGQLTDFHILALLPGYMDRPGSSLIVMMNHFIAATGSQESGFYLQEYHVLKGKIERLLEAGERKILLFGVSFALLEFAERYELSGSDQLIVMETGGMKGRRPEMIRSELHGILCSSFGVSEIHSEYGMTEVLSQAYSNCEGVFTLPFSMRILLRDPNDPLDFQIDRERGGINLIDLANIHSCAFLQTGDLGEKIGDDEFRILGRLDNSDIRGCNLLVQQTF